MGMTITEKILAAKSGAKEVKPGDFVVAKVDLVLANDITAPLAIQEFRRLNAPVFDPAKIAIVPDHFTPNKDIKSAEQAKILRDFARGHGIRHYFEVGRMGIEHALLPEQGLVAPGELIIGADSHTCTYGALGAFSTGVGSTDAGMAFATGDVWLRVPESMMFIFKGKLPKWVSGKDLILAVIGDIGVEGARYRAMEFAGPVIEKLSVDGRLTMCNMAIEAGGKNGIIAPDDVTGEYIKGRVSRPFTEFHSDADARYAAVKEYDVSDWEPLIALPHLPSNVKRVSEARDIRIDQAVIGSCTNGRMEDLRTAAQLLKGRSVAPHVRAIVIPGTQEIWKQCLKEGLAEIFVNAGAVFSTPTCGPCLGGHMGVLAKGERSVATTNRNFVGRMGHPESEVILAGPAVAAASAVLGRIAHPDEL
ncbi:MAG TPA: 3-isopropylmalate dehydratase large subunit [Planctomycetes bacterium]|nr:3-isopropylmalate dehydratase large subunit [Planctomycetota bacterium]